MIEPLISVIMPAYNAGKYIGEAINSVIKQTYKNWELIVIDDGSTDDTGDIVKQIMQNDARIIYKYQSNGKQGKARNNGIKSSKGEYIAFLDADDLWVDTKLELQASIMKNRPDIDLIFTQGYNLFADDTLTELDVKLKEWAWDTDADLFTESNQIPILSVIVKKEAITAVNYFSENPAIQNAEDYHLWLRLLKNGNFLSINNRSFYYRIHSEQSTYQNKNTATAVANCLTDLVKSGVLNRENKIVKARIKHLIFPDTNLGLYLKMLIAVFPGKKKILWALSLMNKISPNNILIKKTTFHLL